MCGTGFIFGGGIRYPISKMQIEQRVIFHLWVLPIRGSGMAIRQYVMVCSIIKKFIVVFIFLCDGIDFFRSAFPKMSGDVTCTSRLVDIVIIN